MTQPSPQSRKVVLIMTDTQRADMLGCYADNGLKTPNLDRLAREGIRFDKAYTCSPVCSPARSAIFTGTWPHANGVWSNALPLGNTIKTIGQRLTANGIHCSYIGKWHLDGHDYFGDGICPEGWDENYWYDMRRYLDELTPEERKKSRKIATNRTGIDREFTYANRCSDRAIDFLDKHGNEDFLLVVSYDEPHGPFLCPEPFASQYKDYEFPKKPNVWDNLDDKPEHHQLWSGNERFADKEAKVIKNPDYFGCHSFVDDEIGRVISAIDTYAPDALVIYTADHGDMMGSHSMQTKGPAVYEENVRIPFLIRWPEKIAAESVCQTPVSHIDILPTIMDAMGYEKPHTVDGSSLCDIFADPSAPKQRKIFIEFGRFEGIHGGLGGFQPLRAVFDGRYKLCINLLTSDEFYDLQEDPEEMHNLIHEPGIEKVRNQLHDELLDWMIKTRDPFRGYYWERRPWRTDAQTPTWKYTGERMYENKDTGDPEQLDFRTGLPIPESDDHYVKV